MVTRCQAWISGLCAILLATQPTLAAGAAFAAFPPTPESTETSSPTRAPSALDGADRAAEKAPPLEEPIDAEKYVCGPGDQFQINFWGQQNTSIQVVIDTQGRAFVPKVGYVVLDSLTLASAMSTLKAAVAKLYPKLRFDLSLIKPRTFLVHVVGSVSKPGIYQARATDRLTKVLDEAGGGQARDAQDRGAGSNRRIEISRRNGKKLTADLLLYRLRGDTTNNPYLSDGDVIVVPFETHTVAISGGVQRPGRYELVATKDLTELVDVAGGLHSTATTQLPIVVSRRNSTNDNWTQINLRQASPKALPSLALQHDDRVHIPTIGELQRSVLVIGALAGAAQTDESTALRRMPYEEGDTVRRLIDRAGGVAPGADYMNAFITRTSGKETTTIPLDLEALLVSRDMKADVTLKIGDTLNIPFQRRAVMVEGAVVRPGSYAFNPQLRALDYVAIAGGPGKMAQDADTYRLVTQRGKTSTIDDKTFVRPGDTLVIPERHFSRAEVTQIIIGAISLAIMSASVAIVATK